MHVTTLTTLFIRCFGVLKTGNSQSGNPPARAALAAAR